MTTAHRIRIETTVVDSELPETAAAFATKSLIGEIGDVDVISEASASTWKGYYNVMMIVQLTDEQAEMVEESESVWHMGVVDDE